MNETRKDENVNIQPLSDSDLDEVSGGDDGSNAWRICPQCETPMTINSFAGGRSHCSCSQCGKSFIHGV